MPYTWITFAQAKTALKNRLGDSTGIYWLDDEVGRYLKESLRTLNSIGQLHRARCTFNTITNQTYYDLTSTADCGALTTNPPALVGYNVQDRELINDIQYHLIEPITTNWALSTPAMTDQFTMDDIVRAIERCRNQFMLLVASHLTHSQVLYGPPAGSGRVSLSDSIIYVRRVSWLNIDGDYTPLWRDDEETANFLLPNWAANPSIPEAYSAFLTPPVSIQIIPPSNDVGTIDLITVNNPSNLDQTVGTLLFIPDDFSWVTKWGALAALLSKDTQAYDPIRAKYCQTRYEEGIRFALTLSLIQQAYLDGIAVAPQSFDDIDGMLPSWQNQATGTPTELLSAGRNLIALTPTPDSNQHSVQLDVVRNIPIPLVDGDFLQIGKEFFEAVLDYSVHLAMFKDEGDEFFATVPLANNLMQMALQHNAVLNAEARGYTVMEKYSTKEEIDRPRLQKQEAA